MGFIRGGLFTILSIILLIGILALALVMTVSKSLEYQNVEESLGKALVEEIEKDAKLNNTLTQTEKTFAIYCQNKNEFALSSDEYPVTINVSCESVRLGQDAVVDEVIKESVAQIYYKTYDCDVWDCLDNQKQIFFFFSQGFKNYVDGKETFILISILIMFILIFLLAENRSNAFIVAGILMVLASLPFMKLSSLFWFVEGSLGILFKVFFGSSYSVFIKLFIIGILLLAFGLVFKFTSVGTKLMVLLDKLKRKQDEEETQEKSKKSSKSVTKKKK